MRHYLTVLAVVGSLLTASCGGGLSAEEGRLASALCVDLDDGLSLAQLSGQAVDYYEGQNRSGDTARFAAAELLDAAIRDRCPEYLDQWEATRLYETWIAP